MNDREFETRALVALCALALGLLCGFALATSFQARPSYAESVPWQVNVEPVGQQLKSEPYSLGHGSLGGFSYSPVLLLDMEPGSPETPSSSPPPEESPSTPSTVKECPLISQELQQEPQEWLLLLGQEWPCSLSRDEHKFVQLLLLDKTLDTAKTGVLLLGVLTGFLLVGTVGNRG